MVDILGGQVDRKDNQIKARLGRTLTDNQVGYPNCSLVGVSQVHSFVWLYTDVFAMEAERERLRARAGERERERERG